MARSYQKAAVDDTAPDDDPLDRFKRWYRQDVEKANKWRGGTEENGGAKEDYKFRDGDQWSDDDKTYLEDQDRPVIVFNRTGVLVDAVTGIEVGNRREVRYIPRELNDSKPNEVLSSAAEWFRDLCDAEDEESEAFKDTITAGMGWTETRIDRTSNPDGEPKIERVDPFEMVWDCNAVKANLVDSKRRWRVRADMDIADAMDMFPDADIDDLNAAWATNDTEGLDKPHKNDKQQLYTHDVDGKDGVSRKVTIVQLQYVEKETYYKALIMTPDGQPQMVELDAAKFKIAEKNKAVVKSAKLSRETVKQVFLGRIILKKPMPTQTGLFTFNCMTGLKDEDKGIFYGVVRRAKGPQRWANKWLSQMLHIMNSQAKGGIIAVKGVADNQREFEESWAKTEAITWVKSGALAGEKWAPKPMAQFPAGFAQLMQYADEMIIKATGISMELLGIREVNQPGVLEYQRKQAGMGILATFFDSKKRYCKIQGRLMLKLIQDHLSDGRLIRIVGDDLAQYVPLMKKEGIEKAKAEALQQAMQQGQQMAQQAMQQAPQMAQQAIQQGMPPEQVAQKAQEMLAQVAQQGKDALAQITAKFDAMKPVEGEYDIIVDDAPSSPNDKEKNWQIIQSMLPMFKDQLGPEQVKVLFKYSPLPTSFGEDIEKSIQESQQAAANAPPSPEVQLEQAKLEQMKMQMEVDKAKIEADREKTAMTARKNELDAVMAADQQTTERQKLGVEQTKATADIETAQAPAKEAAAKGNDQMAEAMKMFAQAMQMMNAPKRRTPIRDPQTNRIVDVVEQPMQ